MAYNYAKLTVNLSGTTASGSGLDERVKKEIDNVIDEVVKSVSNTLKSVTTSLNAETRVKSIYVPHKDIARYIKAIEDRLNDLHIQAKVMYESLVPLHTMKRSIYDAHSLSYIQSMVGSYGGTVAPVDKNRYLIEAPNLPIMAGKREIALYRHISSQIAQMNRMYKAGASGIPQEYMKYAEGAQWFYADAFPDSIKSGSLATRPTGILRSASAPDKSGKRRPYSWGSDFMDAELAGNSGGSGGAGGNGDSGPLGAEDEGGSGESTKGKSSSLRLLGSLYLISKILHLIYDVIKNIASEVSKQGKEVVQASFDAFRLGVTTPQLVGANRGAAAMGLPTDTFTGAAQALQTAFGNVNRLDKSKLEALAPFLGNDTSKVVDFAHGKIDVFQLMDIIGKHALDNMSKGLNPIGEQVGTAQAAAAFNTVLSAIDPNLASLVMAKHYDASQDYDRVRQDAAKSMGLAEYYFYRNSRVSSGLVQDSTRNAYAAVGKEVTELQTFFKYLKDDFFLTLLPLLEGFLRGVKSLVMPFLPENVRENLRVQTIVENAKVVKDLQEQKKSYDPQAEAAFTQFFSTKEFDAYLKKNGLDRKTTEAKFKQSLIKQFESGDYSIPVELLDMFGINASTDVKTEEGRHKAADALLRLKRFFAAMGGSVMPKVIVDKLLAQSSEKDYQNGYKELPPEFRALIDIALSNFNNNLGPGSSSLGLRGIPDKSEYSKGMFDIFATREVVRILSDKGFTLALNPNTVKTDNVMLAAALQAVNEQSQKNPSYASTVNRVDVKISPEPINGQFTVTVRDDKGKVIGSTEVPAAGIIPGYTASYEGTVFKAASSSQSSIGAPSSSNTATNKPYVSKQGTSAFGW